MALGDHLITFETQYQDYNYSKNAVVLWYPETHWPDPWVEIGALSQITATLKFMTTVYVLPMRDPVSAAKAVSTAARLSSNRVVLGIGIGWQESEFDLVDRDFSNRGARTDEMLTVMEGLMTGEMTEFSGRFYKVPRLQMSPGVTKRVPILVGGRSPAAYRRAARYDGWVGAQYKAEDLPEIVSALKAERMALGKSLDGFEIQTNLYDYSADTMKRVEDMGVTQIHRSAWLDENGRASKMTLKEKIDDMERFAEQFMR
jgi:alkanesulfonate monooxygenase SsuD/methylene tetrahydromethanopterin reductase-like flavin-dependent oxidoreductase (luciferase family)